MEKEVDFDPKEHPHRRYNPLLDEYILVSPHRAKRPWLGQNEAIESTSLPEFDPQCYLCPGNTRTSGKVNDKYEYCFAFDNDFPAVLTTPVSTPKEPSIPLDEKVKGLFKLEPERGVARVICFSPRHNATLPLLSHLEIIKVVEMWQNEYVTLGKMDFINHVQIFENKGSVMGCSNPHPHCQIWAQSSIPSLVQRTAQNLLAHFSSHKSNLLADYLQHELQEKTRIVAENKHFVLLVPYWATWPYEVLILPKRCFAKISEMTSEETSDFAAILKTTTTKLDAVFQTSFPYSAGIHQAPPKQETAPEWMFHMHFYPPLLRSATVKKFMVGYEMMAESQRDMTPEQSAEILRSLNGDVHYSQKNKN